MYNVQCTMYNVRVPCSMQNVSVAEKVKLSTLEILATSLNNGLWSPLITGNKYTFEKFIIAQTIPYYTYSDERDSKVLRPSVMNINWTIWSSEPFGPANSFKISNQPRFGCLNTPILRKTS